jgi:Gpi18-like mannosyltransferase
MKFKKYIHYFLTWRFSLLLIATLAIFFIPLRSGYTLQAESFSFANLATMWANFDGLHYLSLAEDGYENLYSQSQYAFFPVYPFLIRKLSIMGSYLTSALLISHISLILAIYVFYKLVLLDFSKRIALRAVFLVSIFPTSFFFGSINSESLFLLLTVSMFYLVRKKLFLPAALLAAIASATRLVGIFLWPVLFIELWQVNKRQVRNVLKDPRLTLMLLPPLGLLSFMRFQFLHTGNWISFITGQPSFGANRTVDKLILLHQVFYRYFKMLTSLNPFADPIYFTVALELIITIFFLGLVVHSFKKTRLSYAVFAALSFLTPTLTGTFSSMPRYVLTIFPAFIVLAIFFNNWSKKTKKLYVLISVILSITSVVLYTRGYFIA